MDGPEEENLGLAYSSVGNVDSVDSGPQGVDS